MSPQDRLQKMNGRRAVLPLAFEPRMTKTMRLWRKIFLYYSRHAGRVYYTPEIRERVKRRIAEATLSVQQCTALARATLTGQPADAAFARYPTLPPIDRIVVEARFPEVVEYLELFRLADQLFSVIHDPELKQVFPYDQRQAIGIRVSEALRSAAQVISEAGEGTKPASVAEAA